MKGEAFGLNLDVMDPRSLRTHCDECGSDALMWTSAVDLLQHAKIPEIREGLVEIVAMFGGDADAWLCTSCWLGVGAFGPLTSEGF